MYRLSCRILAWTAALHAALWSGFVRAHHSNAVFDTEKTIELRGTIVDFKLRDPHASFVVEARVFSNDTRQDGVQRWEVESESSSMLRTLGIDEQTFEPGEPITIQAWPHRDPSFRFAHAFAIVDAFGAEYVMANSSRLYSPSLRAAASVDEAVSSEALSGAPAAEGILRLTGRWQQPLTHFAGDGPALPLNETGMAAWHSYDRKRSPANTCEPINIPDIFFQPFFLFEVRIEERTATLRNEIYDVVRTIPLSTDEAPADAAGWFGSARGHVEGDSLVVESHGFRASRWGLGGEEAHGGADVPSSAQKKLTERFSVSPDGRTLFYDYTLEDPVYLTGPERGRVELTRVPEQTSMYDYVCDLESAAMWSRTRADPALRIAEPD